MEESDEDRLRRLLEEALAAADAVDDTLVAAKLSDCLWLRTRANSEAG